MFKVDTKFPDFSLETYNPEKDEVEKISNDDFNGRWLILFFYPADFTFVCPTEIMDMSRRAEEFKKGNTEVVVVSTDTVYTHKAWIEAEGLLRGLKFRMAADHNGKFSKELDIYDEERNLGMAQRAAFIVDPDGILRAADIVSDPIGRSAGEILRKLKALRFVRENPGKVCPASWDEGAPTLTPSVNLRGLTPAASSLSEPLGSELSEPSYTGKLPFPRPLSRYCAFIRGLTPAVFCAIL